MPPKKPRKRPEKRHQASSQNKAQVAAMALIGADQTLMARVMGISRPTLLKYYRDELDYGKEHALAQVANALVTGAMKAGSDPRFITAAIFVAKTQLGWRETSRLEHTGADGDPITIETSDATEILRRKLKLRVEREAGDIVERAGL